jgi:HEAT repeat protein/beta-lactamase regulating signal transducer with metallopeptidase domain
MTIVESVGWVLLHFVWQGAAIALALAGLLALTGEAQARLRYALSCAALILMLAVTLATAASVRTGGIGQPRVESDYDLPGVAAATDGHRAGRVTPTSAAPAIQSPRDARADAAPGRATLVRRMVAAAMPWLVGGWMIGVLLLSMRLLAGWWGTRALGVVGVAPAPEWCHRQLVALSERMRISRPVALVSSIRLSVPVVIGHARPVIVLPMAALSGLSAYQLEAILAHELAHVRRHDYLVNLAQTLIETLLFYHPAVWWVSRQVRVTREHCCDDLAVTVCRSRHEYVHALLDLEELRGAQLSVEQLRANPGVLALGATGGSLLARGRRLLAPTPGGPSSARLAASVIGLTVVAAAAASASLNPVVRPSSEATVAASPVVTAGSTGLSSPQTASAAPVIAVPDASTALESRWAWAERTAQAARHRRYWIGYAISPVKTLPAFVYFDRSSKVIGNGAVFNGHLMSRNANGLRFPGQPLALTNADNAAIKLLFELDVSRGAAPALVLVHGSTVAIPVDTNDLPVFWLGAADAAQSLERIDRFYRSVSDPDLKHDLVAAAGVHDLSPRVVAWLEQRIASQDDEELRGEATEWIAWHPIEASVRALDRIARTDRSSHVRQEAAEALGDLAMPEAAPVLIALAKSLADLDARREAVEALGARPEPAARDALASIARQDADVDVQREAVETLGDFEDRSGVPFLLDLVRSHPTADVRREAVETLADTMPGDAAVPFLQKLVKEDADPDVQREAIEALAGVENPAGVGTLMELARSQSNSEVRREALEALSRRAAEAAGGDQKTIVELLARLAATDRDTDVQVEATESLGEIGGAAAIAELRKLAESHADEQVRAEAIETLGESRGSTADTVTVLKQIALADKSLHVQSEAMETLADLPDGAGVQALVDLARDHPAAEARRQALEKLLESEHPAARAVFDRALGKKSVR